MSMKKTEFNIRYFLIVLAFGMVLMLISGYVSQVFFSNLSQRIVVCSFFIAGIFFSYLYTKLHYFVIKSIKKVK